MKTDKDKMDHPNKEELEAILDKYSSIDLNGVSMPKLMKELNQDLRFLPFTTALLKKGWSIERARINKPGQVFYSENEISYRTDISNITEFGRANLPHTSLFYGSIVSEKVKYPRIVNLLETEEVFREKSLADTELTYTVGKWKIKEDFELAEIVFSETVRKKIPKIQQAYEYHAKQMKSDYPESFDYLLKVLEFFSNEFAKTEISSHNDYKLSAAYSEFAFMKGLNGVVYPSVRTEYEGLNVAIPINAVETFLELDVVGMFQVFKRKDRTFIKNAKIATNLGPMNSQFQWEDMPDVPEETINKILLG